MKNLFIYRIANLGEITLTPFVPCGPTQERSFGWVPPRGEEHAPLVELIDGQRIMKMLIETKSVPSQVIARKLDEAIESVEIMTGRKVGKKERRDMRENVLLELLPSAFAKRVSVLVWIDTKADRLIIDTPSQARADLVITDLVSSIKGVVVSPLVTQQSPVAFMTECLLNEFSGPEYFNIDRYCELKSFDEEKSVVRFVHHNLQIDEIQKHIRQGKLPTSLALTWQDRVSFVFMHTGQIRKLTLLDVERDEGGFDADIAIFTGELRKMIPDLIGVLGGEGVDR